MNEGTRKIPLIERGNYYRGLLVLIRRDRVISSRERELMLRLGKGLDFDVRFCENAINELPKNPHIKAKAMKFSDQKIAELFLHDAIALAFADGHLHPKEWAWLRAVAAANGLKDEWLETEIGSVEAGKRWKDEQKSAPKHSRDRDTNPDTTGEKNRPEDCLQEHTETHR